MKIYRFGIKGLIHRIHHPVFSFGWVLFPSMRRKLAFFPWHGWRRRTSPFRFIVGAHATHFHDCTATGVH